MEAVFLNLTLSQWLDLGGSVLIVFVVGFFGRWLVNLVVDQWIRILAVRTRTHLDDALADILRLPLYLFSLIFALDISLKRLEFLPVQWDLWLPDLLFVLYLVVGFVFAWRFVHNIFIWYSKEISTRTETNLDEQLMPFFRRIAMIILWMVGIITILGHFQIDVSALVTTLGIGSLAVALAAQASLADTISGFIIMVDRPFRIGDRIEIQDLDTWGDVVDIGLRSCRIRTRDNRMVIIPNSVISKSLVVNYSYPDTQYRIETHIGLPYGVEIEKVRRILVETVASVEGILTDKQVEALFIEFGSSALIFRVRWWLESYYDTRRMFDKVNSAIYLALSEAGIELPIPQIEVQMKIDSLHPNR